MPIRPELRHFYRGLAWNTARAGCRERAHDRCEHCRAKNGHVYVRERDGRWVLIQCGAAHLNNVAGDDRPENLAWLCRGCHLRHDREHHHETRAARKDRARPLLNPPQREEHTSV
jgi:hypothetical protein